MLFPKETFQQLCNNNLPKMPFLSNKNVIKTQQKKAAENPLETKLKESENSFRAI
jgi:hypothetical protein